VDELHGVIVDAVALTDTENRHDVAVVQSCCCLRLAAEAIQKGPLGDQTGRQHLQRDVPAQRFLDGLVDDAHAAVAYLADDPIVPQPARRSGERQRRGWLASQRVAQVLAHQQRGNSLRMRTVSSEWRAAYSSGDGRSPRR
jgi:hypothetical protein